MKTHQKDFTYQGRARTIIRHIKAAPGHTKSNIAIEHTMTAIINQAWTDTGRLISSEQPRITTELPINTLELL